ncbi:hypothetical protein KAI30_03335, partial [Candidatus Bathyarchaeota archaeon]|nr:hypothetical protein [Candidatus Bathyarchaeota archaeon]
MTSAYHAKDIEKGLSSLGTSREGLSSEEAQRRLQEFGYNELVERKRVTPLQIFLSQFKDIFVIMLIIAVVISVVVAWYKTTFATSEGGQLGDYVDSIT